MPETVTRTWTHRLLLQAAADEFATDLRTAAFVVVVRRVAEAARLRGLH